MSNIVGMYIKFQLDNPFSSAYEHTRFHSFRYKFYVFCKWQKREYILAISFIGFAYVLLSAFRDSHAATINTPTKVAR